MFGIWDNLTQEQKLKIENIRLKTEADKNRCCNVVFKGKERELQLQEQLNNQKRSCCQSKASIAETCCKKPYTTEVTYINPTHTCCGK